MWLLCGLEPWQINPRAHSLVHLLLQLLKPRGCRPHQERGRSDLIPASRLIMSPYVNGFTAPSLVRGEKDPLQEYLPT